jgi:hypothetical protein
MSDDVVAAGPDDDEELSDAELTRLALAADPSEPLHADAVPIDLYPEGAATFLPLWYMPPVMRHGSKPWHRWAIGAVIVAFITIDVFGLCSTYGPLTAA